MTHSRGHGPRAQDLDRDRRQRVRGQTLHVWLGMAVFAAVLIRIVVRRLQGAPGPLPGATPLMEQAAT
ncbi:hypothetical protein [Ruegeria marina]|uniref:hypothetical protein n=1 Tax=Ruegeria marina TaxID=639004 RepID=UPI000AA9D956|nr:hypothetical protein [Ruegeria marina]